MISIYTLPNCRYCTKSKELMNKYGVDYIEINLKDPKNRDAREYYRSLGVKTAPIIKFDDGTIISKFDEAELIKKLDEILK